MLCTVGHTRKTYDIPRNSISQKLEKLGFLDLSKTVKAEFKGYQTGDPYL
jgi:hypothetical protein